VTTQLTNSINQKNAKNRMMLRRLSRLQSFRKQSTNVFVWNNNSSIRYFSHNNLHLNQESSSTSSQPSIKSKIMQIYKKTHPDLFENYPEKIRLTNQQSLQKLNNFLDEYKGYDIPSSSSPLHNVSGLRVGANKYPLEFYIKSIVNTTDQQEEKTYSVDDLTLVKVTLTGPPAESGIVEKSKAMTINFSKLFRAMKIVTPGAAPEPEDIELDFMDEDLDDEAKDLLSETFAFMGKDLQFKAAQYSEYGAQNIAAFVLKQLHTQNKQSRSSSASQIEDLLRGRQAEIETHLLRHKVTEFLCAEAIRFDTYQFTPQSQLECLTKLKDVLHHNYGVRTEYWGHKELNYERIRQKEFADYNEIHFPDNELKAQNEMKYKKARAEMLQLRTTLSSLRDRMPGIVRIVFSRGNESYVSDLGHVALGVEQSAEEWLDFLIHRCDYSRLERSVKRKNYILSLEKVVCQNIGIKAIISENDSVFLSDIYQKLLEDLAVSNNFPVKNPLLMRHLRIIMSDEASESTSEEKVDNAHIHPTFGFLICPLANAVQVNYWINEYGRQAAETTAYFFQDRGKVSKLINETKRYLQLDFLDYVQSLDQKAVIACCHKMIRSANILKPVLKGLHVIISDGYHWRSHDKVFEIPVDF
jgi:hypothetical protein